MKPNDKAIEAAFAAAEAHIGNTSQREWLREILTAAYAAQFQSKEYAGLVKELRDWDFCWPNYSIECAVPKAADAIETVLAERDALKELLPNQNGESRAPIPTDWWSVAVLERRKRLAAAKERDALAARLAPVDDEALETIAARAIVKENVYKETQIPSKTLARAAIAAIRPHIEAAERERCAKVAEGFSSNRDWVPGSLWGNIRNEIAAAIRSGK